MDHSFLSQGIRCFRIYFWWGLRSYRHASLHFGAFMCLCVYEWGLFSVTGCRSRFSNACTERKHSMQSQDPLLKCEGLNVFPCKGSKNTPLALARSCKHSSLSSRWDLRVESCRLRVFLHRCGNLTCNLYFEVRHAVSPLMHMTQVLLCMATQMI